jgi:ParB family chromosome partitioning protein
VSTPKKVNKHGLGRGFESLIPTDLLDESFDPTAQQDQQVSELRHIKLNQIIADASQPRQSFDEEALAELATSIKEHGVIQPIIVVPYKSGYQIVAGERRYRASLLVGLDKIPALVRTLTAQHKLELSLIENLQRRDLNAIETATAYLKLRDQFNLSIEQIGARVGDLSRSTVINRLRLLQLPGFVRDLLIAGNLNEGQARTVIGIDEDTLKIIVPKIIKEGWSVRKIEQFIVNLKKNRSTGAMPIDKQVTRNPYKKQVKQITDHLKTDVKIHTNAKGAGYIRINFKDESEFDRLQKIIT